MQPSIMLACIILLEDSLFEDSRRRPRRLSSASFTSSVKEHAAPSDPEILGAALSTSKQAYGAPAAGVQFSRLKIVSPAFAIDRPAPISDGPTLAIDR